MSKVYEDFGPVYAQYIEKKDGWMRKLIFERITNHFCNLLLKLPDDVYTTAMQDIKEFWET